MKQIPAHYIRENKAAYVPRRLVIVDSESHSDITPTGETQTWRCGAAQFIHWTGRGHIHRDTRAYTSPDTLWSDIGDFTRPKQRTVLYTHNLPFDIRITQALRLLPEQRWNLAAIRIANQGAWSRWTRDKASLTLCDSTSLFPVTLYTIGKMRGQRKLALPDTEDIGLWMDRCIRDVEILADTMVEYFNWLRTGVAGNWQLTGAGQAWAHWRHAHYTHPVLVHADDEATSAERRAMWTGRAEAFRWGLDYETPIFEWDWQNAYPRIARDHNMPVALVATAKRQSVASLRQLMDRYIVLADVEVNTNEPIVPTRHNDRILWPIGQFETTLWDPELRLLVDSSAQVRIQRVWLYRRAPALKQWASWILQELHRDGMPEQRWGNVLLKHWSRALIGRFATQYQNWELFGIDPSTNVLVGDMHDRDTGQDMEFMQVGHEVHVMTGLTEGDDSCPQITSYIMSVARQKLWTAMETVGLSNVLYVDTDSIVVNTKGNAVLRHLVGRGMFNGLRLKSRARGYEIFGPRTAVIGGEEKLSGIPRNSIRMDQERWKGEVWTSFERAIRSGEWDRVSIRPRSFSVKWNEHRRSRVNDGRTAPYTLPGYTPSIEPGPIPAVTDREKQAAIRRGLKGHMVYGREDHTVHPAVHAGYGAG